VYVPITAALAITRWVEDLGVLAIEYRVDWGRRQLPARCKHERVATMTWQNEDCGGGPMETSERHSRACSVRWRGDPAHHPARAGCRGR